MNYKELQKEAKRLGLKYVGVSEKNLKGAIELEKSRSSESSVETPEPKVNKKINAAIVYNGKHEVRRYTVDIHGESFAKMAEEFVKDRDYIVKLIEVKPGIVCPSCGHTIYT